jgi:phage minor structural protein, N-terminal domain protein|nr:MAG TPA: Neck appendage protein [Caudoviricetes sp.]
MKLFLFNNDEKLIGTVSPLECIQNEEINKIQTIECTVVYSELIEKASYIGHKDYSDNRIFHLYKIDHVTKTSTTDVIIVGVHTFFDDMESDGYVKDFRPTNRELVGVLTTILDGSRWQLGTVNIQRRYTGNFYYVTRKEALSKLIEATQIEIKPRLEFSRGKITGRYLDVFTRLGGRNGKVFVHGRDLLTVSEKKSQGAIYTAVVGRGKGEETDTGGYGRRISFKDVEWRRTSGQPVDKPVGQEYVEIPAMTKLYGFEKGTKPRIKIVEFQDETDKEKLLRLSYEWLEKNSRMQVEYSAKVLNVGNLELGDTVGIFNPKLGIKYETRVFKVKRNLVNNKLTEFGIGDKVTTSPFSRTIELAKEMKNFQDDTVYWLDKIRERLSDKLINEDGYNYDLKANNEYKVPAGYYSFDKPIDQNPTKVVYMGAGKIAIADSKKPTGEWNWKTFLDGRGATLDLINTGVLKAGRIQSADGRSYWDLDTGEFHMEQSAINESVKTAVNGKVQEIVGEVKKNLPTKEELKGKSSYLHKKYSDFADGRNMSDNSTLKYIGIYTGDKQQAPSNTSEYSWTKIRGEDGRDGVDGKSINRNYISDSNNLNNKVFYSWNKWDKSVEGDTLVLTKVGGSDTYGFYFNLTDLVKTQFQNEMLTWSIEIKASRNMTLRNVGFETNGLKQVDITTEWQKISHTFINKFTNVFAFVFYNPTANFNNGDKIYIRLPKLEKGNVATEWSPAYEDLQAHSLTANLRFEGKYINSVTTDVKVYLDVYYDGQKVDTGFDVQLKDKGGTRTDWSVFWNSNVNDGLLLINKNWKNGEQNGQPLELIALVTYKGLNSIANARMENVPDIVEIKEITKKYKTFESTIDRFDSTIGEVKQQVLANEEKRNLIIGSRLLNASDYKVVGKVWDAESKQGIYTQIKQSTGDGVNTIHNGNSYLFAVAQNNTKNVWQGVQFNISSKILLPGRQYSLSIPYYILGGSPPDKGIFAEIKNHNTGRVVWKEELTSTTGYRQSWIEKKVTFRTDRTEVLSDYSFWIYAVQNGGFCISAPYMCEGDVLPKAYSPAPEDVHLQNSRIESSIKQTKDEIDLKVSKDNVIASINASVETTGEGPAQGVVKINADKVDISGTLRAYTGEIGGFRIGYNYNDGGFWLTGKDNFDCGINPGLNAGSRGAQVWAAWGNQWNKAGPNAWWVNAQGVMTCKNTPVFAKGMAVYGGVIHYSTGTYTYSPNIKKIYMEEENGKTWIRYYVGSVGPKDDELAQYWNYVTMSGSDKRYKSNIKPTEVNGLEIINNLKCYDYDIKLPTDKESKHINCGIMAQDVEIHMNEAHLVYPNGIQSYTPFEMQPYLIKAIQELSTENQQLKSQLTEMNERLTKLEDKINGNL